jgi:hypothetical protein
MKMLLNNKGVSLVVLIIAMTLIAILGVSFVSLIGSKQKGFLYQIDSYRALNLANAGVEYMIKYANDETSVNNSTFFSSTQPFVLPTKQLGFGAGAIGTFDASYVFDENIGSDVLTVTGVFGNSTRQVKLSRFRYYAFENITRVPGSSYVPTPSTNYIIVPVILNPDRNGTTSAIIGRIGIWFDGLTTKHLQEIHFQSSPTPPGDQVYDFSSDSNFTGRDCPIDAPHCRAIGLGINIPPNDTFYEFPANSLQLNISTFTFNESDGIRWCILRFSESGSQLSGQYRITFYNVAATNVGTLYFRIP